MSIKIPLPETRSQPVHGELHTEEFGRLAYCLKRNNLPSGWTAQVNCPIPAGWTVEQARQALRVRSLADVVPGGSAFTDRLQQIWIGLKPINIAMRVVMGK